MRLLIVGNPEPIHVGAHLRAAADELGVVAELCDTRAAFDAGWLGRQWSWRVRGHRPPRLDLFNTQVLATIHEFQPTHLVATGLAPLTHDTLASLRQRKVRAINFLTDDPWNPSQRAEWFLDALSAYEIVFTPRRANENDLQTAGCARVEYLPFAYNPRVHFPDTASSDQQLDCDILFAGGADADRVPYLAALIEAGLDTHLYGGYWERYAETRNAARGHAPLPTLRRAVHAARVCLNLVRRANRDDHVMRSFEIPAMGGCMLTEDSATHRALFGAEGAAVLYFRTRQEMVDKARWLLDHAAERARLAHTARALLTSGKHTYGERLTTMLEMD